MCANNIQPLSRICVALGPLMSAELLERENRFRVRIRVGDSIQAAHLANPGRLEELMVPGRTLWVKSANSPHRKTQYDLSLVEHQGILVSLNSHLPNQLLDTALRENVLSWFGSSGEVQREVSFGDSRLDFRLSNAQNEICWIEAKSVTLVNEGLAQFPDAPTERGRRHLLELQSAVAQGNRGAVVFMVQREDARAFAPHDGTDPAFGDTLRAAARAGVEIRALRCTVTPERICLDQEIAIHLDGDTSS